MSFIKCIPVKHNKITSFNRGQQKGITFYFFLCNFYYNGIKY